MKAQPIIFPPSSDLTAKLAVLASATPISLRALGNPELLTSPTLALFCSARAPARVILQIHDLTRFFQDRALISPDMTPVPLARSEELDAAQIRAFRQLLITQDPTSRVLGYDDGEADSY